MPSPSAGKCYDETNRVCLTPTTASNCNFDAYGGCTDSARWHCYRQAGEGMWGYWMSCTACY